MRLDDVKALLDAPSPGRADDLPEGRHGAHDARLVSFQAGAFEVVLAEGDVKRQHLARTPRCVLVVFEAEPPFRGVEVKGEPELVEQDVTEAREVIAGRYLGEERGRRFAATRRSRRGTLLRLVPRDPRVWDLSDALPE